MLVLIVGPSGAGKDTLLDAVRPRLAGDARFRFVRRVITRPAGVGTEDHVAVDDDEFARALAAGEYAFYWDAHGLSYAIPADVAGDLAAGRVVVASVSRSIVGEAARRYRVRVVEITAPPDVLAQRLSLRRREDAAAIAARLARQVPLPAHVQTVQVLNDATVADGADRLLDALIRAAECAGPAGRARRPVPG